MTITEDYVCLLYTSSISKMPWRHPRSKRRGELLSVILKQFLEITFPTFCESTRPTLDLG